MRKLIVILALVLSGCSPSSDDPVMVELEANLTPFQEAVLGEGYVFEGRWLNGEHVWLLHVPDPSYGECSWLQVPAWAETTKVQLLIRPVPPQPVRLP